MSLFMPRMPSGKAMTASSFVSRSMAFLRVPTTEPVRTMSSFSQGTVGSQYSPMPRTTRGGSARSEEHTSELQSHHDLVCRLLLEKKKNKKHLDRDYDDYSKRPWFPDRGGPSSRRTTVHLAVAGALACSLRSPHPLVQPCQVRASS